MKTRTVFVLCFIIEQLITFSKSCEIVIPEDTNQIREITMIVDQCDNFLQIDNRNFTISNFTDALSYFDRPTRKKILNIIFVRPVVNACAENDTDITPNQISTFFDHLGKKLWFLPRKPAELRLYNAPGSASKVIFGLKSSLESFQIENCFAGQLNRCLRTLEVCQGLRTLKVRGPINTKVLAKAMQNKEHMETLKIEKFDGIISSMRMSQVLGQLNGLKALEIDCLGDCTTNFTDFAIRSSEMLDRYDFVTLISESQKIDRAALELSERLKYQINTLKLRGRSPIGCEIMGATFANLLQLPSKMNSGEQLNFDAKHDCPNNENLWFSVQRRLLGGSASFVEKSDQDCVDGKCGNRIIGHAFQVDNKKRH